MSAEEPGESLAARVDIIIAARNEERYLGNCLDALRAQDYPEELLQIYLVDNGSTDGTVRIAEEYGINVLIESLSVQPICRDTE